LANKIIVKNNVNNEPKNNKIAQDRGVGSADWLCDFFIYIIVFFWKLNVLVDYKKSTMFNLLF
tara:strand:+ start:2463 stop:2651 length:189 start_codon:yes stop_codon:yes gene_type:complete